MKIAVVVRYFPAFSETFVAREVEGLRARGHEVVVIGLDARRDLVPGLRPPVDVWRPDRSLTNWGLGYPSSNPAAPPSWRWRGRARALGRRLRRWGVDRVHLHFAGEAARVGALAAEEAGVPYSLTTHAVDLYRPIPQLRALLAGARPALTVCAAHQRWIARHHGLEVGLLRMGVPFPPCARPPPRPGFLRVVTVARDVPKKGLPFLRGVLEPLAGRVRWDLISDAPSDFPGALGRARALPPDQVAAALAQADLFALACQVDSSGDRDGVPVAAMEAMAVALPAMVSDVAGTSELVDGSVGWLLPEGDAARWREALLEALDPRERARRGQEARRRIAAAWTLDHQVEGLLAAWRSTDGGGLAAARQGP